MNQSISNRLRVGGPAPLSPMAKPDAAIGRWVAFGVLAWLAASVLFLVPIVANPDLAIRGDDYWGFSQWFGSSEPYPHTFFGPSYPLFIRILRELGMTLLPFLVLQKLLLLLNGYLLYRLGRGFGLPLRLAAVAGLAYAVYPLNQAFSSLVFAETFYVTLLLGGLSFVLPAIRAGRWADFSTLLVGFTLLGLAALARGNGLVLCAGLGLLALYRCPWQKALLAGLIGALPILAWSGLNYHWYGHFKPTASGDANIAASIVGPIKAEQEGKSRFTGLEIWVRQPWHDHYPNQFEYALGARKLALDFARENLGAVAVGNVKGWVSTFVGPGRQEYIGAFGPAGDVLTAVSLGIRLLLLAGLLAYFLTGAWRRFPLYTGVLGMVLVAHVLTAGAAGFARFGVPLDAFTTLALALSLAAWRERRTARARRQA